MIFNVRFSSSDSFSAGENEQIIDFSSNDSVMFTFWKVREKFPSWYDTKALDLLYISIAVFVADRKSLREKAYDAWSREFYLYMPVLNCELMEENKELIQKMLSFLTGDIWHFEFRSRELTITENEHLNRKSRKKEKEYNQICMFSGGMDSFIGAIDILENDHNNTLFVSHYGGGKGTKEYQDYLKKLFVYKYGLEDRDFLQFYVKAVGGVEDTTRSRSIMFFAHAVVLASAQNKPVTIIIPENGLISLNIPISLSRIGTSSTRTTHPNYMKMLQKLISNLGLLVTFKNPYQFKTKGEMLLECCNQEFMKENIHHTMSCSHPDIGRMYSETEPMHCGYCLPCVIRQAAIKRAGIIDDSPYRDSGFSSGPNAKMILNSYRLGISKYNPRYAFMNIQLNGRIEEQIEEYTALYIRGMKELKEYIDSVDSDV